MTGRKEGSVDRRIRMDEGGRTRPLRLLETVNESVDGRRCEKESQLAQCGDVTVVTRQSRQLDERSANLELSRWTHRGMRGFRSPPRPSLTCWQTNAPHSGSIEGDDV